MLNVDCKVSDRQVGRKYELTLTTILQMKRIHLAIKGTNVDYTIYNGR